MERQGEELYCSMCWERAKRDEKEGGVREGEAEAEV